MTLNIAIAGTGRIADNQLAPALTQAKGAQLWSVLSRDPKRAAKFAKAHGAQSPNPAYTELDALLADPDLDALIIATPDKLHARQALAAAAAGKHVLVEKPMATSLSDARMMVGACAKAGVKLAVAYHLRWHQGHRKLITMTRAGEFGALRHMRVQWSWRAPDAGNWRASPDVGKWWSLGGVGTHCLDLIRWFMTPACGEVVALRSIISHGIWKSSHDETAILAMRFDSGATAEFCSSVLFESPPRVEIYGSKGYAFCEGTLGPHGGGKIRTQQGDLGYSAANPYVGEIEDFVNAIADNRAPEVDGREGLRNVELLLQATE